MASSAFAALLWRDALCLWRTERATVRRWVYVAFPLAGTVYAMTRHTDADIGLAGPALSVFVALLAPSGLGALNRLGKHFAPWGEPITPMGRAGSLAAVAALPLLPLVIVGTAVSGAPLTAVNAAAVVAALAPALAFCAVWSNTRRAAELYTMWFALASALVSGLAWPWGAAVHITVAPLLLAATARRLAADRRRETVS